MHYCCDIYHILLVPNCVQFINYYMQYILHDWNDEDCVKILKQCRNAIHAQKPGGKVIIIDIVVGSPSKDMFEAQVSFDLL